MNRENDELSRDEEDQVKECPECGGIMKPCIDTKAKMSGDPSDDDTNLVEWWNCLDCDYYE